MYLDTGRKLFFLIEFCIIFQMKYFSTFNGLLLERNDLKSLFLVEWLEVRCPG